MREGGRCGSLTQRSFQYIHTHLRKISGHSSAHTSLLGGGVDRDKDQIGIDNGLINVSGEEQVLATTGKDDLIKTGLVNGEVIRVPGIDTGLVQIDDGDVDVMALVSNNGGAGTTCLIRTIR